MYKILSLDGGGVYGSLTVVILQRLLEKHPKLIDNCDLIAGTSIGAAIGLLLANGVPPKEVRGIFPEAAQCIFERDTYRAVSSSVGFQAYYPGTNLKKIIGRYFDKMTLNQLGKKVLVPTFDLDNGKKPRHWKAKFYHNFEGDDSDGNEKIIDILMATTAAPVFFPTYGRMVDGCLVESNPAMCAIAQTQDERMHIDPRPTLNEITLLSLGRGNPSRFVEGQNLDWGFVQWMQSMTLIALDRDSTVVHYQSSKLLNKRYHRIAPEVPEKLDTQIDRWDLVPKLLEFADKIDLSSTEEWLKKNNWI